MSCIAYIQCSISQKTVQHESTADSFILIKPLKIHFTYLLIKLKHYLIFVFTRLLFATSGYSYLSFHLTFSIISLSILFSFFPPTLSVHPSFPHLCPPHFILFFFFLLHLLISSSTSRLLFYRHLIAFYDFHTNFSSSS